ncbi:MAG: hypothetical protein WC824_05975 [Bacteroidota bacterium]|jgi:hypothetical protein
MKRLILAFSIILIFAAPLAIAFAQTRSLENDQAIVIFKYDRTVGIWQRTVPGGEYQIATHGDLYRSFPTGPKTCLGDERIPEGIYSGRIDPDGKISIRFETLPGLFETYRISGPSLDRNVIPVRGDVIDNINDAAKEMLASGSATIPVIILPGTLEPEVADMLRNARNIKEGQSIDDVETSIRRWRPVEDYLVNTGKIPRLKFDGADIIILADDVRPSSIAAQ